ncbi:hypothetical protein ATCVMN08101_311L [Acanthocystis turfacea Chlorella virus MN0810.1]|nr:hypothetical protein ATCVMN08101_311L [Acanthocystis turfacea Chlorella virus MN0810.1]
MAQFSRMSSDTVGGRWSRRTPLTTMLTTVILFSVRVPVLSLRSIEVLPRVSHAAMRLTNRFSLTMRLMEYVRTIITAAGSPSGMPTTRMVIENTRKRSGPSLNDARGEEVPQRTICAIKTMMLTETAASAQYFTKRMSFFWRGVFSDSVCMSERVLPNSEEAPTATTTMRAFPSVTVEPERNHGSSSFFRTVMFSPVRADSSMPRKFPVTKRPSVRILSPDSRATMSPTTTSLPEIRCSIPSRMTLTK